MISGAWLTTFVVGIITAIGGVWLKGKSQGVKEATNNITIQSPMPEVPVKKVYSPPTFSQHMDLVRRVEAVESNVAELRRDQMKQFRDLLEVGEARKDAILERFNTVADGFHARVDQVLKQQRKEGA